MNRACAALAAVLSLGIFVSCGSDEVTVRLGKDGKDYSSEVRRILEAHPDGNVTLRFEKGVYEFYPEEASEDFLNVSNNDSGDKKVAFLLRNMKNVNIIGDSTAFLFHGSIVPFAVKESENVRIEGLSVDYDYPWTFEGEILSNDTVNKSFVLKAFPDNKYRVEDGRLLFGGYDWEYPMGECIVFDPRTRRPYYNTAAYEHGYWAGEMKARDLGDGVIEFSNVIAREMPPVGSVWDDKGPFGRNRSYPGIAILSSKNVIVEDVHVYRSGAMALIAEYSENITVSGFSTAAREGSRRMVTASADATHFVDCKGLVTLENCRFESMLDDATNIHGIYMRVDSVLTPTVFMAKFGHFQQEGARFADAGDTLRFIDRTTLRPIGLGSLLSIDKSSRDCYRIETDFDLSGVENPGQVAVENITRGASAVIRDCVVRYNRARSLLISTPGDVLIENCDFSSMMAGIRICGDANYWFEAGNTRNVVVRGNKFSDLGIGGHNPQAILQIDPVIPKAARGTDFFYHDRIVFTGNTVSTFDNQVIYALSVKDLEITKNIFMDSGAYKPIYPQLSVIDIQYCGDVNISDNDFTLWKPDATISIHNCLNVKNDAPLKVVDSPNPFFYES